MSAKLLSPPLKFFEKYGIIPRAQQVQVVQTVTENWDKYKYFALSLPVGVGKTYIATALADSLKNAYLLTSTLQLQDQYLESWGELINLKGRGNYTCAVNQNFTVDAAPCAANPDLFSNCARHSICPYLNQKKKALAAQSMITNSVYMLYSTHCGFAKDETPWVERSALIIDEAHNTEAALVSFSESEVDPEQYHVDFGAKTNGITFTGRVEEDYFKIIEIFKLLQERAEELAQKLEEEFPRSKLAIDDPVEWAKGFTGKLAERVKKLNSRIYQLDKAIQPLKIFFNTHVGAQQLSERWIISKHDEKNVLKLSPIYGDFLFKEYFGKLASKFVFLSATLGTKREFCKELGLDEAECLFIETDSPFKPELSPIIIMPSIKLSKECYPENVKKVGKLIDDIMSIHSGCGLVHATTYDIAKHVYLGVSEKNQSRLLTRDMDVLASANAGTNFYVKKYKNAELLSIHTNQGGEYGSVLLSPSMMEGVDLYDDLSEFQVIIKLPWANLGDVRVKIKSKLDPDWYTQKMWLGVLQASGRSTRHEEDTSITYILDENFTYWFKQWENKLPKWFKDRLIF